MENPFEILQSIIQEEVRKSTEKILSRISASESAIPGINLDKYISLKDVSKLYGVSRKTLSVYKGEIEHVKRFGQIYFVKDSLAAYMEAGRPQKKTKAVMTTGRKNSIEA